MKTLGGIGAMILGVVAILVSAGLQTIWAPPAEFNATTGDTQEAPLTLVTSDIDIDPDEAIEYTVTGDGEFTLMYGQLRDMEAWIGDAAHNRIDGITTDVDRGEEPTVDITYVEGETDLPNPVNSDLWLATQEVTDEVTQRWARNDVGEWALLIATDGTEPAPTDVSATWINIEPNSPLIVPLLISGIALIVIGIGLLIWRYMDFRRRAKRTSGRRAVLRGDYTGLTAADVVADTDTSTQTMTVEHVEAGEPVQEADSDQQTQVVAAVDDADEPGTDEDSEDDDSDDPTDTLPIQDDVYDDQKDDDEKDNGFLRRTVTGISALGLALGLGIGPAHAETETPTESDISEQVEEEHVEDDVDPQDPETFPVVVDAQLEHILEAVSATIEAGDAEQDADLITGRVAGQALSVREESYRNNTIDEDYADRIAVASDEILATWMVRDEEFPRTIYTVTSDAEGAATQLLVLRQEDARSQYQLIHNAPFAPGAELPPGSLTDADVERLADDDATGLVMSPDAAVEALSQYLTDPDADAADSIADNAWIDSVHEYQQNLTDTHGEQEVDVSVSRSVFEDSVDSVRLPNGSALVFGAMNSLESLTPEEGATVTVNTLTQELGDFESAEQQDEVRIRYREQFAMLIPQEGEVSLVGYETIQSTVDSPDN